MKKNLILLTLLYLVSPAGIQAQNLKLETHWWQPNGMVKAIVKDTQTNTLYIGGDFDFIGPPASFGSELSGTSGIVRSNYPMPNGPVNTVVSDGKGGWYIGGDFTSVGDSIRNRLAHVDSNGTVTSECRNTGFNNTVRALSLKDSILIVGGDFSGCGTSFKDYGVAFNTITRTLKPGFPAINKIVHVCVPDGKGGWYIGGDFSTVGDSVRNRAAQIDSNGKVTNWNPNLDYRVRGIVKIGNKVYLAGLFSKVGKLNRPSLVEVDDSLGLATSWLPNLDGSCLALGRIGDTLLVSGQFSSVNGLATRNHFAAFNTIGKNLLNWNPSFDFYITDFAASSTHLFVCGDFTTINGVTRNGLAALDPADGSLKAWNPLSVGGDGNGIFMKDSILYVAGGFNIGGRKNVASFNSITGNLTSWIPSGNLSFLGGGGYSVAADDSNVYVGLSLEAYSGTAMYAENFCAFNKTTGALIDWFPSTNVYDEQSKMNILEVNEGRLFMGGKISGFGGVKRDRIAAINVNTGNLATGWSLSFNGNVRAIALSNDTVFIGGYFNRINGMDSSRSLYTVNARTGNYIPYSGVQPSGNINVLTVSNGILYVGGEFSLLGGVSRQNLGAIHIASKTVTSWNPSANGIVYSLAVGNNAVYAGGEFTTVKALSRNRLAEINISTGIPTSWNPQPNGIVRSLGVSNTSLYTAGEFTLISGQSRLRLAKYELSNGVLSAWDPGSGDMVLTIGVFNPRDAVYIGGAFTTIGGVTRNKIAALNCSTGMVTAWNPNITGSVMNMNVKDSILIIAGAFTNVGGQVRNNLAFVNKFTGSVMSLNPNVNGTVNATSCVGRRVYFGGSFSSVGGTARTNVACYHLDSGLILSWNSINSPLVYCMEPMSNQLYLGVGNGNFRSADLTTGSLKAFTYGNDGSVFAMTVVGKKIYAAGSFLQFGGNKREGVGCFNTIDERATTWNPNPKSSSYFIVKALAAHKNYVYTGGGFLTIGNDADRPGLAAVTGEGGVATSWNPSPNGEVRSIHVKDSSVYIGGAFTSISNQGRAFLACYKNPCYSQVIHLTTADTSMATCWDSVRLDVVTSQAVKYEWLREDTLFSIETTPFLFVKHPGKYKVRVTNTLGCTDTSATLTIRNILKPSVLSSGLAVICQGDSVVLKIESDIGLTYQWINGSSIIPGANKDSLKAGASGNYRVVLMNSSLCKDTSSVYKLVVNTKPATSPISGLVHVHIDTPTTYSVINTPQSVYFWKIDGGTKKSGGNTNSILIDWTSLTYGKVEVVERDSLGCRGDTMRLTMSSILPVEFLSFSARLHEQDVLLNWKTGSEFQSEKFEIERSLNAQLFEKIGNVKGSGTTSQKSDYHYNDYNAIALFDQTGVIYYRLKQIDFNGKYQYSKIVSVTSKAENGSASFSFFPNPSNTIITFKGLSAKAIITDILGTEILVVEGDGELDISGFEQGVYFIHSGTSVQKLLKN